MTELRHYFTQNKDKRLINRWDFIAISMLMGILFVFAFGATQMATPYNLGQNIPITLSPAMLPTYALRTVFRMGLALLVSLLFTFIFGTLAAKNKKAEKILIPVIDVLQSVPVLSFLSITIVGFIKLFPGSMLGPECASVFAIFTAQAWNMTLGFYQTVSSVPHDLREAADMFHLSSWQRFWRVEVPFSMSSLLWNTMMSMSASWFFVVATEAILVSNQEIRLPGIGSYIWVAIHQANIHAVLYAIGAMLFIIFFYDQFIFRPLIQWSEKFQSDLLPDVIGYRSWFLNLLQRTRLVRRIGELFGIMIDNFINITIHLPKYPREKIRFQPTKILRTPHLSYLWNGIILVSFIVPFGILIQYIIEAITLSEITTVFLLGCMTALRVIILVIISSLIWIPVGVWIGQRPKLALQIQPFIQFAASFPANLFFPIAVMTIVKYQLNVNIWTTPLMILGSQWYILFNVISGAISVPRDLYQAADNYNVKGWLWWKRIGLPGVFPYYITGAITAAGGAWNSSILAEWVSWGDTTLIATGLGAYIAKCTAVGDFPRIALGTAMMCLFVLFFNRVLWQPLYTLSQERFRLL